MSRRYNLRGLGPIVDQTPNFLFDDVPSTAVILKALARGKEPAAVQPYDNLDMSVPATEFKKFPLLPAELQAMVLKYWLPHLKRRRVTIRKGKSIAGEVVYRAAYDPPHPVINNSFLFGGEIRDHLITVAKYTTLSPKVKAGRLAQPDIWFHQGGDVICFDPGHFSHAASIEPFLASLTQQERDRIRNIEFVYLDQSWQDSYEFQCKDMLLSMRKLRDVAFLEDSRGHRDAKDALANGEYRDPTYTMEALSEEGWRCPSVRFKLDRRA